MVWFLLYFLVAGLKAILQADAPVKHKFTGLAVFAVGAEVAKTHKLICFRCFGVFQALFHLTAGENFQRVGVQTGQKVLSCGIGIGIVKKVAVLTNFCVTAVIGIHPMDGSTLDLAAVCRVTATGVGRDPVNQEEPKGSCSYRKHLRSSS